MQAGPELCSVGPNVPAVTAGALPRAAAAAADSLDTAASGIERVARSATGLHRLAALDHPDQHHDDGDDQQDVDQAAHGIGGEEAEEPEDHEEYGDGHHRARPPFRKWGRPGSAVCKATTDGGRSRTWQRGGGGVPLDLPRSPFAGGPRRSGRDYKYCGVFGSCVMTGGGDPARGHL